jgi:hypothetical protein
MDLRPALPFFGADPQWSCWSWLCLAEKFWSGVGFLDLDVWSSVKHALDSNNQYLNWRSKLEFAYCTVNKSRTQKSRSPTANPNPKAAGGEACSSGPELCIAMREGRLFLPECWGKQEKCLMHLGQLLDVVF